MTLALDTEGSKKKLEELRLKEKIFFKFQNSSIKFGLHRIEAKINKTSIQWHLAALMMSRIALTK